MRETNPLVYVALHAIGAGGAFFALQRYVFNSSLEISLVWAVVCGLAAAFIAYKQTTR